MSYKEFLFSWYGCATYFFVGLAILIYLRIEGVKYKSYSHKGLVGGIGAILYSFYLAWLLLTKS
jgi:hypothetical protein